MPSEVHNRIAKNTGFLYIRMLITMAATFYTSRVVLNALGIESYGIYNVVGGMVAMFSFLTGTFTACTQRFLNYEQGHGNKNKLQKIVSMSLLLNALISILIVVIAEIIGLWFINHKLVISTESLYAAHWVFQFTLITMVVTIMSTPYNAVIISHERMNVFAYISIVETFLKLSVALIIDHSDSNRLILYSGLILLVALIIRTIYSIYCRKNFQECHFIYFWDQNIFKDMAQFAGWNLYGNFAFIMITQGINMMLNIFFGPAVNASRGIAVQVQNVIQNFANNFTIAVNPRITQNYALGKNEEMFKLILFSSKFSFFLLLLLSFPILIETNSILKIWLGQVPNYSVIFMRIILVQMLIRILQNPLHSAMHATGRMKKYQLIDGSILLLNIPISYILLINNAKPQSVFITSLSITFIALFALLYILRETINFSIKSYIKNVLIPVLYVCLSLLTINLLFFYISETFTFYIRFGCRILISTSSTLLSIWFIGMKFQERKWVIDYIKLAYHKIIN